MTTTLQVMMLVLLGCAVMVTVAVSVAIVRSCIIVIRGQRLKATTNHGDSGYTDTIPGLAKPRT